MRINARIAMFCSLAATAVACGGRPVGLGPDAAAGTSGGSAGAGGPGTAGTSGAAGTTGTAGTSGAAGTTGFAGTAGIIPPGCDRIDQIIQEHSCTLTGACHDAHGSSAGFSLTLPFTDTKGWRARLVGQFPKSGGVIPSACVGASRPYLVPGSVPAAGLLLDKLRNGYAPCGEQMPALPPLLSAVELDCVQRWANALTAGTTGPPVCPLTCASDQYCQFTYSSGDGGVDLDPPGAWSCRSRPSCAGGTLDCVCLSVANGGPCFACSPRPDHFRCDGI